MKKHILKPTLLADDVIKENKSENYSEKEFFPRTMPNINNSYLNLTATPDGVDFLAMKHTKKFEWFNIVQTSTGDP